MEQGDSMTVSEIDVYRTANLLVTQHGTEAPIHAAMKADAEDREPFMEDEIESDDDKHSDLELDDADLEPDCPGARRVFAAGRMVQGAPQRQPWRARYYTSDNGALTAAERFRRALRCPEWV